MNDKEIRLELKENNIVDNPFDLLVHYSLHLSREIIFACNRFKEEMHSYYINEDELQRHFDKIKTEFEKINNMSDEAVTLCRNTSAYNNFEEAYNANKTLISIQQVMETVYTRNIPCRNDEFERVRLGENSNEYKRLLELRDIVDNQLSNIDDIDSYLYALRDASNKNYTCIWNNKISENAEDYKNMLLKTIDKYNLTTKDIEYMISYNLSNTSKECREYNENGKCTYYKDSDGYERWFDYDENNNLVYTKDTRGNEYRYDKNGNVLYVKYYNGIEIWYEYDERGNEIHYKTFDHEHWKDYDENNNLIHYKDSNGFESWKDYDENNNLIHTKNNHGFEEWKDYDNNGNNTHYKTNDGYEMWYEYDKNGNIIHFKDSDGDKEYYEYDKNGKMHIKKINNTNNMKGGYLHG